MVTGLRTIEPLSFKKSQKIELESACGIIFNDNAEVLLCLSNAEDDRNGKWCFPGGGIDKNEDCISASIRETYEEVGLSCQVVIPTIMYHVTKPKVGFCLLKSENYDEIIINEEFDDWGWFDVNDLPDDILSINKDLLEMVNYGLTLQL